MKEDATGSVPIAAKIRELSKAGTFDALGCNHIPETKNVLPSAQGCEDCLKIGDEWVNLRLCLTCGYVGCCDNSKNKHATRHHHKTHHPMILSYEQGEEWLWCYVDEVLIEP
jgi:uncharacterized UBP type Zn finger protein